MCVVRNSEVTRCAITYADGQPFTTAFLQNVVLIRVLAKLLVSLPC